MIYVRSDDVILPSKTWSDPVGRFRQQQEWIESAPNIIHVPTILVTEIQEFPDCIQYIKDKIPEGKMIPQIHGLRHIDYGKLSKDEVKEHLKICKDKMFEWFGQIPTKWYSPWGSTQTFLHEAAAEENLQLIDCSNILPLEGRYGVVQRLKDGEPISNFDNKELFIHWWTKGARLARVCAVARYGSWDAAVREKPELFK